MDCGVRLVNTKGEQGANEYMFALNLHNNFKKRVGTLSVLLLPFDGFSCLEKDMSFFFLGSAATVNFMH